MRQKIWTMRSWMAGLACVALVLAAGCAYTTRHALPAHIHSIAIPEFKNKTFSQDYSRHIEVEVTESTRNAFIQTGELALASRESADLILEGEVTYVDREVLRQDRLRRAAKIEIDHQDAHFGLRREGSQVSAQ